MAEFQITISEVLRKIRNGGEKHSFSLEYRKEGGKAGKKENVRNRVAVFESDVREKRDLASITHETQEAGKLHLVDEYGQKFDLFICLLTSYNGKLIDHSK